MTDNFPSTEQPGPARLRFRVGSAPDSWGVWFPDDPRQTPWSRFLGEIARAAGLQQSSLYYWFKRKELILQAVFAVNRNPLEFIERVGAGSGSPALKLYRLIRFDTVQLCESPCDVLEVGGRPAAEGPAGGGEHQLGDLVGAAAAQALRQRGVFGVDRHDLAGLGGREHQRATGDQRFLVRQGQPGSGGQRGQRRLQAQCSDQRVEHDVGLGVLDQPSRGVRSVVGDVTDGLRGALVGGQVTNEEGFLLARLMREGLDSPSIDSRAGEAIPLQTARALAAPALQATVADLEFAHTVLVLGCEPLDDARIDRLPPDEKALLQAASVIGPDVPFALLKFIADVPETSLRRALIHLEAAEFLYETSFSPDPEYTFKQTLTHEVAYASLLHDRRRTLHVRIVDALETLYRDRLIGSIPAVTRCRSSAVMN